LATGDIWYTTLEIAQFQNLPKLIPSSDKKIVFCTGGSGDICSAQVRAMVALGANACITGRNKEKAERVAATIRSIRPGAKVLVYAPLDVRNSEELQNAARACASALGGIDYVM
jgi:peroxisomal 2,4-dienoyl-CoA reductase